MTAAMWPAEGGLRMSWDEPAWSAEAEAWRTVTLWGWAFSVAGDPELEIEVDGGRHVVRTGLPRPDVADAFGAPEALDSGWRVRLPLRADGPAVRPVVVTARDPAGASRTLTRWIRVDADERYARWLAAREPVDGVQPPAPPAPVPVWIDGPPGGPERAATVAALDAQEPGGWTPLQAGSLHALLTTLAAAPDGHALLLAGGDVLEPHALAAIGTRCAAGRPDVVYCDDDELLPDGRRVRPRFKPQWSPELLLARDYVGGTVALSGRAAALALAADPAPVTSVYDLLLRLADAPVWAERIPEVLVSHRPRDVDHEREAALVLDVARRRGARLAIAPVAPGVRAIDWEPAGTPRISIVVVTARRDEMVLDALSSLLARAGDADLEVIVVDDSGRDAAPLEAALAGVAHRILGATGPFNYSRRNNVGAAAACGEFLLFANDDLEMLTDGWPARLVGVAQQPNVGMVGARLVYPHGTINHGGITLDPGGSTTRLVAWEFPGDATGLDHELAVTRECLAVGTAFALMPRELFTALGGFDEALAIEHNDTDLALRAQALGRRVLWTPSVTLVHRERATRGSAVPGGDQARFRMRWERLLTSGDPFWNPNVGREPEGDPVDPPPTRRALALALDPPGAAEAPPNRPVAIRVEMRPDEELALVERLVPELHPNSLLLAEHVVRYRLACTLAAGADVLDAGCGTGYGTRLLHEAGARRAVGVDVAPHAIAGAAEQAGGVAGLEFLAADARALPFDDGTFDLAVCFDLVAHVDAHGALLDELRRVLRPGGVALVSTPDPQTLTGDARRGRALTPSDLAAALRERFAHVATFAQTSWQATLLAPADAGEAPPSGAAADALAPPAGAAAHVVVAAGDAPLPALPAQAVLSGGGDVERLRVEKRHLESLVADLERRLAKGSSA